MLLVVDCANSKDKTTKCPGILIGDLEHLIPTADCSDTQQVALD